MKATNRYIAVVDDEASVRNALNRLLRSRQFDPLLFANGEEFLRSVSLQQPDCALVDIDMPGISGFDVAQQLASARIRLSHHPHVRRRLCASAVPHRGQHRASNTA